MFRKLLIGALVLGAAWVLVAALPDIARGLKSLADAGSDEDTDGEPAAPDKVEGRAEPA